jgi:hypothetical protein
MVFADQPRVKMVGAATSNECDRVVMIQIERIEEV